MCDSKKCCSKSLRIAALALAIVGALNWGLVGIGMFVGANWNVVHLILGRVMWLEAIVYLLVGLSGIVLIFTGCCKKSCCKDSKGCKGGMCTDGSCCDSSDTTSEAATME